MISHQWTRALFFAGVGLAVAAARNSVLSADAAAPGDPKAARPTEEREAVAALERLGVRLAFDSSGHVQFLDAGVLGATPLTDADMQHVAVLRKLEFLGLHRTKVADAGITPIRGLPKLDFLILPQACTDRVIPDLETLPALRMLKFDHDGVLTQAGVERLGRLTKLQSLDLPWKCGLHEDCLGFLKPLTDLRSIGLPPEVTDQGMAYLKQFPHLSHLYIARCTRVTDAGLAQIRGLSELERVSLPCRITDAGLAHLRNSPNIHELWLDQTAITDKGMEVVGGMTELRRLLLPETVTDAGLVHLYDLPLTGLSHPGTTLSAQALARLQDARPRLRVYVEKKHPFPVLPLADEKLPEEDPASVAALRALGADFGFNSTGNVRTVQFIHTADRFTDKQIELLLGLPYLDSLNLSRTAVTDAGLVTLTKLPSLASLNVGTGCTERSLPTLALLPKLRELRLEIELTPAGLKDLNKMTNLERISLPWRSGLDEACFLQLKGLTNLRFVEVPPTLSDQGLSYLMQFPKLEALNLRSCRDLTDAGLAALQALGELQELTLPPGATDAGLRYVSGLTKLQRLHLDVTQASDDGLKELAGLRALRTLSLPPGASDAGLDYLQPLHDLRWVQALEGGQVTLAGVQRLGKSLPRCKFTTYRP